MKLNSLNRLSRVNLPLESRFALRFKGEVEATGVGAGRSARQKPRKRLSSNWTILYGNVFNSIGLCRRRNKKDEKSGAAFIRGERTSVSAGNEAFAASAHSRVSDLLSLYQPLHFSSLLLFSLSPSHSYRPHSLSSSRMKIVFISHLPRAQVNITGKCAHLPLRTMTSEVHDAEKSTLSPRCYSDVP